MPKRRQPRESGGPEAAAIVRRAGLEQPRPTAIPGGPKSPAENFVGKRIEEGMPVPREPAWLTRGGKDAEAQAASRERRPGGRSDRPASGAREAPTHRNDRWTGF